MKTCEPKQSETHSTDLSAALEKVYFAAVEFINDWAKGDFPLPTLAACDASALEEACLNYEREKALFLKRAHEIIESSKP